MVTGGQKQSPRGKLGVEVMSNELSCFEFTVSCRPITRICFFVRGHDGAFVLPGLPTSIAFDL